MARTGVRPPASDAVKALCCDCLGHYSDGRYVDCEIRKCPFYIRMRHRKLAPDLSWVFGKWSKSHEFRRFEMRLSETEYINRMIIRPDGKFNIGFPAMFRAKCFDCYNDFVDGRQDCEICTCPIYYWMPYRELLPDLNWLFDSPYTKKHRERAKWEQLSRPEYIAKYIARPEPTTPTQRIIRVRQVVIT